MLTLLKKSQETMPFNLQRLSPVEVLTGRSKVQELLEYQLDLTPLQSKTSKLLVFIQILRHPKILRC